MNLCASWYPVLIVDDASFSPFSFALATSTAAVDGGACAGGEPAALFCGNRLSDSLGVVAAEDEEEEPSGFFFAALGDNDDGAAAALTADSDPDPDRNWPPE
jgi:hypothetical protein